MHPRRFVRAALAGGSALVLALWIAICAAAPEFIWQGLRIGASHLSRADLLSALLLGLILAFFVEPLMRRIGDFLRPAPDRDIPRPRSVLFTASLSLAFALASVCVHDALIAFISNRGAETSAARSGLAAGIALTSAWAIVPGAVALAWLGSRSRRLKLPLGILGAASAGIAGWLFSWPAQEIITTTIPCLLILRLGYRRVAQKPTGRGFAGCARSVALVAAGWLTIALLLDALLGVTRLYQLTLYTAADFWVDARFYLGWTLGLLLAPMPDDTLGGTTAQRVRHNFDSRFNKS